MSTEQQQDSEYFRRTGCGIFTLFMAIVGAFLVVLPFVIFFSAFFSQAPSPPRNNTTIQKKERSDTTRQPIDTLTLPSR